MTPNTTHPGMSYLANPRFATFLPWVSRLIMFLPAVVLTAISFRFITNPGHAVPGVVLNTPEAFTDTRVTGASMLTLLVVLIVCISSRHRLWLGHLQLATFMGLPLAIRVFGFVHDGTTLAMGNQRMITTAETVFLALNVVGLALQSMASWKSHRAN